MSYTVGLMNVNSLLVAPTLPKKVQSSDLMLPGPQSTVVADIRSEAQLTCTDLLLVYSHECS